MGYFWKNTTIFITGLSIVAFWVYTSELCVETRNQRIYIYRFLSTQQSGANVFIIDLKIDNFHMARMSEKWINKNQLVKTLFVQSIWWKLKGNWEKNAKRYYANTPWSWYTSIPKQNWYRINGKYSELPLRIFNYWHYNRINRARNRF